MEQSLPGREERTLSAETEGARRATGVSAGAGVEAHDPEVPAKARRRQFSPEYRLRILKEADRDVETGCPDHRSSSSRRPCGWSSRGRQMVGLINRPTVPSTGVKVLRTRSPHQVIGISVP
jgi:hypothetical protein